MNPWFSIWLHPRETIRQVVDTDPGRWLFPLVLSGGAAGGVMGGFLQAAEKIPQAPKAVLLLACAVVGMALALVGLLTSGWLYRWVGSWLGGQANGAQVRAVIAYREIPNLWLFTLWLPAVLAAAAGLVILAGILGLLLAVGAVVVFFWDLVIMSRMLGEVHRFSGWKGFSTILISYSPVLLVAVAGIVAAIAIPQLERAKADAQERAALLQVPSTQR